MTGAAERLFDRQMARAADCGGAIDLARLRELVVGAYVEADRDRRRTEQSSTLMAAELEQANAALGDSVSDLQSQNLRFSFALDNMANGLALFDADARLVVCNRRQCEILGIPSVATRPGLGYEQFLRASTQLSESAVRERLQLADARVEAELQQILLDGHEIRVAFRPTRDGGFLTTCSDVTEHNQAAARIQFLAYHDTLTELPNRALLRERLEQAIQRGPCAVLCLDLDGFKTVNDTYGHPAGDILLRAVTARLRRQVRAGETLARLGGDEFAVVMAGGLADASKTAGRMVNSLATQFEIEGNIIHVGVSIGIAVSPTDGETHEELLRHADMALYRAKANGRGCYLAFEVNMDTALQVRRTLEHDLRIALAEGQFELAYQPQVRVQDDQIIGFEALLRWRHPTRGVIPPTDFIPLSEESGLIVPIGDWVLRVACREAMRWPDGISIAVNVSAVQLRGPALFHSVIEALQASGLPPGRLELEVTETAMLNDSKAALDVMHRLRALGVRIAMDDFGTGYSSLNYLQSFPFDRIKIDRSFVQSLGHDGKSLAIVRAVVGLGSSLGVSVTAEGVENIEQLETLAAENCGELQGFFYSRPITSDAVLALLDRADPFQEPAAVPVRDCLSAA